MQFLVVLQQSPGAAAREGFVCGNAEEVLQNRDTVRVLAPDAVVVLSYLTTHRTLLTSDVDLVAPGGRSRPTAAATCQPGCTPAARWPGTTAGAHPVEARPASAGPHADVTVAR